MGMGQKLGITHQTNPQRHSQILSRAPSHMLSLISGPLKKIKKKIVSPCLCRWSLPTFVKPIWLLYIAIPASLFMKICNGGRINMNYKSTVLVGFADVMIHVTVLWVFVSFELARFCLFFIHLIDSAYVTMGVFTTISYSEALPISMFVPFLWSCGSVWVTTNFLV